MPKADRPLKPAVRAAAEEEASRWGASVSFEHASKHALVVVKYNGQSRKYTVSRCKKAKSENQSDWVRQNVRRIVKELGCNMATP